jgi:hypothetical protein
MSERNVKQIKIIPYSQYAPKENYRNLLTIVQARLLMINKSSVAICNVILNIQKYIVYSILQYVTGYSDHKQCPQCTYNNQPNYASLLYEDPFAGIVKR